MADELNTPNHRYYQPQNNILLAANEVSKQFILASGIAKIDAKIINPLFALAEPGVWYDPSDLTTLFQDSAGTTPVTAAGQTVGKMLDKSGRGNHATQATSTQRPTYGINPITGTRNLLTYTEQFDNAAWVKAQATVTANSTSAPDGTTTADTFVEDSANNYHTANQPAGTVGATETYSFYAKAAGRSWVGVQIGNAFNAYFDIANGVLGTVLSGTASISSAGNGWYRCTVRATRAGNNNNTIFLCSANGTATYLGNGTSGIYIWGAQLEQSSTATAYQKVVSQYEVTQAGVQSAGYLAFDGVDDGMVTGTITPAIDKVQVFAGVRKLSDANFPFVVELSASMDTNNGSFAFIASGSTSNSAGWSFNTKGTLFAQAQIGSGYPSPSSGVVTSLSNISSDNATLRVNGTQVATSAADQGTGNYLAYPLYIGRRGGTTLPYNGRIYSLIVRFGANLTAGQITSTESWVNAKTGAY